MQDRAAGKKLGVIGLGAIGVRVANVAVHLEWMYMAMIRMCPSMQPGTSRAVSTMPRQWMNCIKSVTTLRFMYRRWMIRRAMIDKNAYQSDERRSGDPESCP